jgi:hypothetical protein
MSPFYKTVLFALGLHARELLFIHNDICLVFENIGQQVCHVKSIGFKEDTLI